VFLRLGDVVLRTAGRFFGLREYAFELPWTPGFLHKRGGLILSVGQFNQWVASQVLLSGFVQIWPGIPVGEPLIDEKDARLRMAGVRLADQGVDPSGASRLEWMCGRF
jgi:electron-transferring-flavoprotein dehydrogenase